MLRLNSLTPPPALLRVAFFFFLLYLLLLSSSRGSPWYEKTFGLIMSVSWDRSYMSMGGSYMGLGRSPAVFTAVAVNIHIHTKCIPTQSYCFYSQYTDRTGGVENISRGLSPASVAVVCAFYTM